MFHTYDIALLKLDRPVDYAPNVVPICLPEKDQSFGGGDAWATGWGVSHFNATTAPSLLREVNVPLKTDDECAEEVGEYVQSLQTYFNTTNERAVQRIANRHKRFFICTKNTYPYHEHRNTCQGDSGGPLAVQRNDGRFLLAGITSFGDECRDLGYYTKVSAFVDWIHFVMKQNN